MYIHTDLMFHKLGHPRIKYEREKNVEKIQLYAYLIWLNQKYTLGAFESHYFSLHYICYVGSSNIR